MQLVRTNILDSRFQTLIVDLDKELWVRYPTTQQNFAPHNSLDANVRVVLALYENEAVGCGAFRPIVDDRAIEIKRMYVKPTARSMGIAKSVIRELEQWGREEGFVQSKLECGMNQPEAVTVYEWAGYKKIPNYPPYVGMADSLCMGKPL